MQMNTHQLQLIMTNCWFNSKKKKKKKKKEKLNMYFNSWGQEVLSQYMNTDILK